MALDINIESSFVATDTYFISIWELHEIYIIIRLIIEQL